jgi:hypothetical protein
MTQSSIKVAIWIFLVALILVFLWTVTLVIGQMGLM